MTDPEGDLVLIHKAELDDLQSRLTDLGDRVGTGQVHFTIKQEKDYRYWVILAFLGILVGGVFLNMMQWNTVLRTVEEARSTTNQMCENVWELLDKGLTESPEPVDLNPGAPEEYAP
jgi:hypothetical protein